MICVEELAVRAGTFHLTGVSLTVPTGEYGLLIGKTGCGKTTILEAICGLKKIQQGRVYLMGRDVTHLRPALRGVGYVPQDGALFPTMSVRDHLAFAPIVAGWPRSAIVRRVAEMARLVGLESLLDRYPPGLSGGEIQRVALGRALASHPEVLCLDEPLSALDDETRLEMCDVLRSVQRRTHVTVLHVTHSLEETRRLAGAVFKLQEGRILSLSEMGNQLRRPETSAGPANEIREEPSSKPADHPNRQPFECEQSGS
jgi:ABC-type sugar transport system ATPase subunit